MRNSMPKTKPKTKLKPATPAIRASIRIFATLAMVGVLGLSGCSVIRAEAPILYDLGAPSSSTASAGASTLAQQPPISVADVSVPAWLDSQLIFFRLNYANQQQPRPYAASRWAMTPGQLLSQRMKLRIAQAGGVALAASDGAANVPMLRIHVDDFSQHFTSPGTSTGRVALRATVFRGRTVVAQRTFNREAAAPSADAAGGAQALACASDAALSDLIAWLAALDLT